MLCPNKRVKTMHKKNEDGFWTHVKGSFKQKKLSFKFFVVFRYLVP